jgi:hypothetical protein
MKGSVPEFHTGCVRCEVILGWTERLSMGSRLALVVAAAVIFAPGWYGQEAPQHPRSSDLAARVLAPTVDEGAMREAAADLKHQLSSRQGKRSRPSLPSPAIVALGLGAIALVIFWGVACHRQQLPLRFRLRHRFSRAPPLLQPA